MPIMFSSSQMVKRKYISRWMLFSFDVVVSLHNGGDASFVVSGQNGVPTGDQVAVFDHRLMPGRVPPYPGGH